MRVPDGVHYAFLIQFYWVSLTLCFVLWRLLFESQYRFFLVFLVEELHRKSYHFREVLGLVVFIFVLLRLEPSLKKYKAALLEIFLADLAEPAPGFDVDPFGVLSRIAFLA